MVNWYAVGLTLALIYIIPKRFLASKLATIYKYRTLRAPLKTVVVILDDIGMNYEKARLHAKKGANIIIGARKRAKAETAKKELQKSCKNKNIRIIPVNRHDKLSLKVFAEEIINTEVTVDVLINNNGRELYDLDIVFSTQELAKERFENHCSNFFYSPEAL